MKDSAGVEIKPGDIIECPKCPEWHDNHWHIAFINQDGKVEIRDLGSNNTGMYDCWGDFFVRGHYSEFPELVDEEDIEYYSRFQTLPEKKL